MELCERVRRLRIEAGMTQNELAGDQITRNMLSQIENGSALPSIQTLRYLAERLHTSPAYFLSDDHDDFIFKKAEIIESIKTRFKNGDYNTCIQLCSVFVGKEDDELSLILAECFFYAACDDFRQGRLTSAQNGFTTAQKYAAQTSYSTDWLVSSAAAYLKLIDTVNIKEGEAEQTGQKITETRDISANFHYADIILYVYALAATENLNHRVNAENLHTDLIQCIDFKKHITARIAAMKGNRGEALRLLCELDHEDTDKTVRFHVYHDLEKMYTQIDDYENAYNYSRKRIDLYLKMQE